MQREMQVSTSWVRDLGMPRPCVYHPNSHRPHRNNAHVFEGMVK